MSLFLVDGGMGWGWEGRMGGRRIPRVIRASPSKLGSCKYDVCMLSFQHLDETGTHLSFLSILWLCKQPNR